MARCFVSVGSNIEREKRIRAGVAALQRRFGELVISSVYESAAVGFAGDPFYNLVIGFDTADDVAAVVQALRDIEDAQGRDRRGPRFSSRTLDLDLLLYDDLVLSDSRIQLPREEILRQAFVLWPLAEILPQGRHPLAGKSYADLWGAFSREAVVDIRPVPFPW